MPPETLHTATLALCIFTLILAAAALMPQLKQAFRLVRDALLMMIMVLVLSLVGFVGWGRVFETRNRAEPSGDAFAIHDLFERKYNGENEPDPLPLPTADDEQARQKLATEAAGSAFTANRSNAPLHASAATAWPPKPAADYRGLDE